jgi:hypothetical protein
MARMAARTARNSGRAASAAWSPRARKPGVQAEVRLTREAAVVQVHQKEGEVVEGIAGAEAFVEFERVEGHRTAVEENEVGEMQIAVAAPDVPFRRAPCQERRDPLEGLTRLPGERFEQFGAKLGAHPGEDAAQFLDDLADKVGPVLGQHLGPGVVVGDGGPEVAGKGIVEPARLGDPVELGVGREAAHLECVLHGPAGSSHGETPAASRVRGTTLR